MYQYTFNVVRVVDGDTFVADVDLGFGLWLRGKHVRVAHINAPEKNTPEGKRAMNYAAYMLLSDNDESTAYKPVVLGTVMDHKQDKYGRILAEVTINGRPFHKTMIEDGHAVAYEGGTKQ